MPELAFGLWKKSRIFLLATKYYGEGWVESKGSNGGAHLVPGRFTSLRIRLWNNLRGFGRDEGEQEGGPASYIISPYGQLKITP